MVDDEQTDTLIAFGDDLIAACAALFRSSDIEEREPGISNPKVLSLTLMLRSVNNFLAMRVLLEKGFIVEARTIVRSIYENLFWLAALSKKGDEFVAGIVDHDTSSRLQRGRDLLSWAKKHENTVVFEEHLKTVVEDLSGKRQRTIDVGYKSAADAGGLGDGYIIYRVLSTDAAHPSASSLSRHLSEDQSTGDLTFHGCPICDDDEHTDTLRLACSAMLGICVAANEMLCDAATGKKLEPLFDRWRELEQAKGSPALK